MPVLITMPAPWSQSWTFTTVAADTAVDHKPSAIAAANAAFPGGVIGFLRFRERQGLALPLLQAAT
ncbi:hypothetical protein MPLB_210076 [Mesorhizobium sp. ORS 3324]|nr:hypothetical protein MPLB_210076 [Mesorhizobium sp. ORS 3324]